MATRREALKALASAATLAVLPTPCRAATASVAGPQYATSGIAIWRGVDLALNCDLTGVAYIYNFNHFEISLIAK